MDAVEKARTAGLKVGEEAREAVESRGKRRDFTEYRCFEMKETLERDFFRDNLNLRVQTFIPP